MKFILFVEGDTERKVLPTFLKKWLDPRLSQRVSIQPVRFNGWPELINDLPKKALMYLAGPQKNDIIAVIALLDLYDPKFIPPTKRPRSNALNGPKAILKER